MLSMGCLWEYPNPDVQKTAAYAYLMSSAQQVFSTEEREVEGERRKEAESNEFYQTEVQILYPAGFP